MLNATYSQLGSVLLLSNVIEQEALVNLLGKKGMITKAELLEEIKWLREKKKI